MMFTLKVYHGPELFMDHSQRDFVSVLKLAISSVIEVTNQGAQDYRIEMCNKAGERFFLALGPKTIHPENCNVVDQEKRVSDR